MKIFKKSSMFSFYFVVSGLLLTSLLPGCSCDSGANDDKVVYSQVIGPGGGTVSDPRGASVVIPEGALTEDTEITITTYKNSNELSDDFGVNLFVGGADFGPDGLEFKKPVTITFPSSRKLIPGQRQSLFVYNDETTTWDQTDFVATANSDASSISAEVTHFTPYASALIPEGSLSIFTTLFDGNDGHIAFGYYLAWFFSNVDIIGFTTECGDTIYEAVGVFLDLNWQSGGTSGSEAYMEGEKDISTVMQFSYTSDYTTSGGINNSYSLLVTVYFSETETIPESECNISILEPLPNATVSGLETISTYIVTGEDNADITSVDFYIDGTKVGSDSEPPFEYIWDTSTYSEGEHTLQAKVAVSTGATAESETVTVNVGDSASETVADPVFSPDGGDVSYGDTVSITSATSGATIYYTTDGSVPSSTNGSVYSVPINLTRSMQILAIATATDMDDSEIISKSFYIPSSKIYFASDRGGNVEIYSMNMDGTNITNLTNHSSIDTCPSVSPDGSKIAFMSNRDEFNHETYIMNNDGSNVTRLTNDGYIHQNPSFSPDGQKIIFNSNLDETHYEIYTINIDGTNLTRLTNNSYYDSCAVYSPDGSKIVFVSNRDTENYPQVYIMNSDGTGVARITNDINSTYNFISVNPFGSSLIASKVDNDNYTIPGGACVLVGINYSGGETEIFGPNFYDAGYPDPESEGIEATCYSNDGRYIIMSKRIECSVDVYLFRINSDGSGLLQLTTTGSDIYPSCGF